MISPTFTFDGDANGWLCEPFDISGNCRVFIELTSRAPVVTLKEQSDGDWANCGQTPSVSDRYQINLHPTRPVTLRLAVPVEVTKCFIIEDEI